jgi:hypothetical protein
MEFASTHDLILPRNAVCEGDRPFSIIDQSKESIMAILASSVVLAAAGYSLLYLLFGGGLGGAVLIFIVAKMLGK